MADANLNVKITAESDQAVSQFQQLQTQIDSLTRSVQGSNIGQSFTQIGASMTQVGERIFSTIAGVGSQVVDTAAGFEAAMNTVRAVTSATGEDFQQLEDLARELGGTTSFTAAEAAAGMEFLGRAGFETTEILAAMPKVLSLASADGISLASAADITSNVLSAFGLKAKETARIVDVLAEASRSSNTNVEELGHNFRSAAPLAASFGTSVEETTALLGLLGNIGFGARSGTSLSMAMTRLMKPTNAALGVLEELGITIRENDGSFKSFTDILQQFADTGAEGGQILEVFGAEAGRGILSLIENIRAGEIDVAAFTEKLQEASGTADEMASIRMEGFSGQMKALNSAFQELLITIGDTGLLGELTNLAKMATGFIQDLSKANPELLKTVTIAVAIVGAIGAIMIPLGMLIGAVGQIITLFSSGGFLAGLAPTLTTIGTALIPIALVALKFVGIFVAVAASLAAILGLIHQVIAAFQEFGAVEGSLIVLRTVFETIVDFGALAGVAIMSVAQGLLAAGLAAATFATQVVVGILRAIQSVAAFMEKVLNIPPVFSEAMDKAVNIVLGFAGNFLDAGRALMEALGQGIRNAIGSVTGAIGEAMERIMAFMPGSDAKVGALSNLTASGAALFPTFTKGVMSTAPVLENLMNETLPELPTTSTSNVSAPVTVNITLNTQSPQQGDEQPSESLLEQLRAEGNAIAQIVQEAMRDQSRTAYV